MLDVAKSCGAYGEESSLDGRGQIRGQVRGVRIKARLHAAGLPAAEVAEGRIARQCLGQAPYKGLEEGAWLWARQRIALHALVRAGRRHFVEVVQQPHRLAKKEDLGVGVGAVRTRAGNSR